MIPRDSAEEQATATTGTTALSSTCTASACRCTATPNTTWRCCPTAPASPLSARRPGVPLRTGRTSGVGPRPDLHPVPGQARRRGDVRLPRRGPGADLFARPCALAYAADLGSWQDDVARRLADVDLLALEFNHDVYLQRSSGRSPRLIARCLGDHGHLSNVQAAALVRHVLTLSEPGRLRHVVQLHLSRDCNRPGAGRAGAATPSAGSRRPSRSTPPRRTGPGRASPSATPRPAAVPPGRGCVGRVSRGDAPSAFVQPLFPDWAE